MVRKRSVPWIHRWSRPIMGAIAVVGAILTIYITINDNPACSTDAAQAAAGCSSVLSSPYAYPFGRNMPKLSFFGASAYLSMAIFALSPLFFNGEDQRKFRTQLEKWTWLLLLIGSSSMAVFSSYLMYVLFFKLQAVCYYCITSALFCLSLFTLSIIGNDWEDMGEVIFTSIIAILITIVTTLGIYANVGAPTVGIPIPEITTNPEPPKGWPISTDSGEAEIALAKHLTAQGIKMYGAFWCPHCYDQKQLFGKEAWAEIDYVECDPKGEKPRTQLCIDQQIKGYPSWEIEGKISSGTKLLDELAKLSKYQGSTDFKYTLPQQ